MADKVLSTLLPNCFERFPSQPVCGFGASLLSLNGISIVSGLAAAARKGILVKGGVYLESGHKLDFLALDKTGTITHGKPVQFGARGHASRELVEWFGQKH